MTKYEYYKWQVQNLEEQAKKTTDGNLKTFYTNAAEGFREKLEEMTVQQAEEPAGA